MNGIRRLLHHFLASFWSANRCFPERTRDVIKEAITAAEARHCGQIRLAVEAALTPVQLLQGVTAHERALEVFSMLRMWDTQQNSGVLIYVLLGDRAVEIVADRGIHWHAQSAELWRQVVADVQSAFSAGDYEGGAVRAVNAVAEHLSRHFPKGGDADELPNEVALL